MGWEYKSENGTGIFGDFFTNFGIPELILPKRNGTNDFHCYEEVNNIVQCEPNDAYYPKVLDSLPPSVLRKASI